MGGTGQECERASGRGSAVGERRNRARRQAVDWVGDVGEATWRDTYRSIPPTQRYLTSRTSSMPYSSLRGRCALLRAAARGDLAGDDARVNADCAVFERLGHPPDAADVAAAEIGGAPLPTLSRKRA